MGYRIGMLGGSFDPVHNAHLAIANRARLGRGLDKVLLIPAAHPPHKAGRVLTAAEHRLAMLRLAVAGLEGLEPCDIEISRGGVSYTVETVRSLLAQSPAGTEVFLIVGADMAADLPTWREIGNLMKLCHVIPFNRGGYHQDYLAGLDAKLGADVVADMRRLMISVPPMDVSSTLIRRFVNEGGDISSLVPEPVAAYITNHGLYRD
ncbi:MAG TPA: nicotinate-nucleotide adenylyltransferase [Candidatus Brocadiia bacterium]|nr:nicotinate-nucleotide adenylyltransferase [Candidatus Brocadiia bacterium]